MKYFVTATARAQLESSAKPPLTRALVIGGGFSGMAAAIALRKLGVTVDLVELDPTWSSCGVGLTISGPGLRAIDALGVLPAFLARGWCADGIELLTARGVTVTTLPTPRLVRPDVPGWGAILRPVLAQILSELTRAAGVAVRLGVTFTSIAQAAPHVDVTFTDGSSGRYELVIGADGLYSPTRLALFPHALLPRYTGQCLWSARAPVGDVRRLATYHGTRIRAGYTPVSRDELYVFATENRRSKVRLSAQEALPLLAAVLTELAAPEVKRLCKELGPKSRIVFRPLESLLMPQPWAAGRVVLIGDAVHAATPHLASGVAMGIEDALVLAEELSFAKSVLDALRSFQRRRWVRCRMAVESSLRLAESELTNGPLYAHTQLMRESMQALSTPY